LTVEKAGGLTPFFIFFDFAKQNQSKKMDEHEEEEEEEEKESSRTVLLEAAIDHEEKRVAHLEFKLKETRRKAKDMEATIQLFEDGHRRGYLYLEQMRLRRMSLWWVGTLLLALVCTVGCMYKKSYLLSALNGFAFLLVWRGLYVNINMMPMFVSIVTIGLTLKFG
jgi:hypothetical protein